MNKLRANKGITLVALVITIIVLIILAGVSINAVLNGGIITNAKDAKNEYNAGKQNELEALGILEEKMIEAQFTEEEKETAERLKNTKSELENYFNDNNLSYKYTLGNKNQQAYLTGIEEATLISELELPEEYTVWDIDGIENITENDDDIATGMIIKKGDKQVGRIIIYGEFMSKDGIIDSEEAMEIAYIIQDKREWGQAGK